MYPHWKERRLVEVGIVKPGEALEQRDVEAMERIDVTLAEIAKQQKAMAEHTGEKG